MKGYGEIRLTMLRLRNTQVGRPARVGRTLLCVFATAMLLPAAGCHGLGKMSAPLAQRVKESTHSTPQVSLPAIANSAPMSIETALEENKRRGIPEEAIEADRWSATIAEMREIVLENNLALQVIRLDPDIAATRISEEEAKFDATILVNAQLERQDLPKIDDELIPQTRDAQQNRLFKYEAGIDVPLITGGYATVRAPFSKKSLDDPTKPNQYLAAAEFTLSQPLLRNAGIATNVASIRLERYSAATVAAQTQLSAMRILADAEKAYWRVFGAWRALEIRREQYEQATQNLRFVRTLVEEGQKPQIEVVRAEVGVAEQMEQLIVAETDLRLAQRELKRAMNEPALPLDSAVVVVPESAPHLVGFEFDSQRLVAAALKNRLELLELELRLAADAVTIDFARNQLLPNFVLDYGYTFINRGDGFTDAFEETVQGERGGWAVALRGAIPVTNERAKSRARRAVLQRNRRLATRAEREQLIRQEVLDSVDVLRQNWQRILAARQNVIVARVNYDAELIQFREGLRTQTEVLESLNRLGNAQSREIRAIVDYQIAQIDLAFATGTLLGYSKTDLGPIQLVDFNYRASDGAN
ncbi:MAG: TolC family protein [Phycisphaerae bacterium]